jgi:hypothetical protein
MDDRFLHGSARPLLVASLDLRLARVRHRLSLSRAQRAARSDSPHHVPRRLSHELRPLGIAVVYLQSRRDGMVRELFDPLAILKQPMRSIWYGVQASIGGNCVLVMLRAMWPSVNNIRESSLELTQDADTTRPSAANHLPDSSGITTRDLMAFFLFWLISLPAIWFPIHQMSVFLVPSIFFTFFNRGR